MNTNTIKRSTFSEALSKRSAEPFKQICELLMKTVTGKGKTECEELISIIDSTPISLKGKGFDWALENKISRTTRLKAHVALHGKENSPSYVNITHPNINDITDAKNNIVLKEGITYIVDKSYVDYNGWFDINEIGSYFVTRTKINTPMTVIKEFKIDSNNSEKNKPDQVIHLTNAKPRSGKINRYANK